jgi:hypothetical protein
MSFSCHVGNLVARCGEVGNTLCPDFRSLPVVAVLSEVLRGFVHTLQAIAGTESQIKPQLLSSTSFPIHLILLWDVVIRRDHLLNCSIFIIVP